MLTFSFSGKPSELTQLNGDGTPTSNENEKDNDTTCKPTVPTWNHHCHASKWEQVRYFMFYYREAPWWDDQSIILTARGETLTQV